MGLSRIDFCPPEGLTNALPTCGSEIIEIENHKLLAKNRWAARDVRFAQGLYDSGLRLMEKINKIKKK